MLLLSLLCLHLNAIFLITTVRLSILLSFVHALSYIFCFNPIYIFTFARRSFFFTALVGNLWHDLCSFFEYLVCVLDSRCESPHLLFGTFIIEFCIFPDISRVEEGTNLCDAYWVSSAMKTTLNKLLSGVGSLAIYLDY